MRHTILYVNGCHAGGSLLSTRQLVEHLRHRSAQITLLHGRVSPTTSYLYRRASNLEVKLGRVGSVLRPIIRNIGARTQVQDEYLRQMSSVVENGARRLLRQRRPDVLVVSSMERHSWRQLRGFAAEVGVPTVLYLREEDLLPHLDLVEPPDLVLANSESLAEGARARGFDATVIPSVVDLDVSAVESTRNSALLINPTTKYGLETVVAMASALPHVPFVLQESSLLDAAHLDEVTRLTEHLPNVELRRFCPRPADVYRDARMLLAPYSDLLRSNRPRSVVEAMSNGIPVLATDWPGLRETVGAGGVLIEPAVNASGWAERLQRVWSGPVYDDLEVAAREQAAAVHVSQDDAADRFEMAIRTLLADR